MKMLGRFLLVVLFIFLCGGVFASPLVVVYTQTSCQPCHELMANLKAKHIPFKECNINTDPKCMATMVKNKWPVTPVTVVGDKVVIGPNISKIEGLYYQ